MIANKVLVHLADDEWDRDGLMQRVAEELFQEYPQADLVEVYEHGGWYLTWRRDGLIVGSANDCWVRPRPVITFWESVEDVKYIASIRRQSVKQREEVACG